MQTSLFHKMKFNDEALEMDEFDTLRNFCGNMFVLGCLISIDHSDHSLGEVLLKTIAVFFPYCPFTSIFPAFQMLP